MDADLTGRTIAITGASSGIGAAAARRLHHLGATVIAVGRDRARTLAIAAELGTTAMISDFAVLDDVRALAERLRHDVPDLDVLVHNAGALVPRAQTTVNGFELTVQVNYLAPFLLQQLLSDRLAARRGHVVITSSMAHRVARGELSDGFTRTGSYSAMGSYSASKAMDLMWARALARRTAVTGITAVSCHPGLVRSSFGDAVRGPIGWLYRSPIGRMLTIDNEAGAVPLVHLAGIAEPEQVNGQYWDRTRPAPVSGLVADVAAGERLWQHTTQALGL